MSNSLWKAKKNKYILTTEGLSFLVEKYNSGLTQKQLADAFNVSRDVIKRWMKENNIEGRKRKYSFNENYFSNISSPEQAYWLGFLSADGYVSNRGELVLELQEADLNHIKKFKKALNATQPIKKIYCGKEKQFLHYRIYIRCKKMTQELENYGIVPNKSLTFVPKNIPENLFKFWILGYLDGDGCISKSKKHVKISFTGTYETLSIIKNYFHSNNTIAKEHRCKNNTYCFSPELKIAEKFLAEIQYQFLPYVLERKKIRYGLIIQQ